jgi:hypothetical protein
MSSYLCSKETISVVADVVSTNFDIEVEEAFDDLLAYNLENLIKLYDDDEWFQESRHYVKVECSEAQKIYSIRNYLYQTTDCVDNDLIQWLQEYSNEHKDLVENATEKLYWGVEDKPVIKEEATKIKTRKQLYLERDLSITEIAKEIRKELKKEFGKDCKFSVRTKRYSGGQSLTVTAKKVTDDLIYTYEELCQKANFERLQYDNPDLYEYLDKKYQEVQFLTDDTISRIKKIVEYYNYDESDIYTDYFDVGFYSHIDEQVNA